MCDRKSRFCILSLLERSHSHNHVFRVLAKVVRSYPCKSFTADQGSEFHCYPKVEKELSLPMYFCSPSSPWQKGSVENLNGLIREFFPKGTNFVDISPEQVTRGMYLLNNRPRKCLNWLSPAETLVASYV
jgi:IS30 family transposase